MCSAEGNITSFCLKQGVSPGVTLYRGGAGQCPRMAVAVMNLQAAGMEWVGPGKLPSAAPSAPDAPQTATPPQRQQCQAETRLHHVSPGCRSSYMQRLCNCGPVVPFGVHTAVAPGGTRKPQ